MKLVLVPFVHIAALLVCGIGQDCQCCGIVEAGHDDPP